MSQNVLGSTEARLFTPALRQLSPATSLGYACVAWNRAHGRTLLPWQEWFLIHALEILGDRHGEHRFRFNTVLLLISRQNGKTTVVEALTEWLMASRPRTMVLGTCTAMELAREPWSRVADNFTDRHQVARLTRGSIDTSLWIHNGSRYKVAPTSRTGGRSLSVDLLILDELREMLAWDGYNALSGTTTARPDSITLAMSNMGDDRSIVLNGLRDTALAGDDPTMGIFEFSAPPGCELDDTDAIAQANPGLGFTITLDRLASKRSQMPAAGYRTEHLCQHVPALDSAIDADAWNDCGDSGSLDSHKGRVVLGFDVSLDLDHATLMAAAVTSDGKVRVEPVAEWSSTSEALEDLPGWVRRIRPRAFGWLPSGPAAALGADLRTVTRSEEITRVAEVCQGLGEAVSARRILHGDDPMVTAQVIHASRKQVADGWRFTRLGAGSCDAVYATAVVVYLARKTLTKTGNTRILLPA